MLSLNVYNSSKTGPSPYPHRDEVNFFPMLICKKFIAFKNIAFADNLFYSFVI